MEQTDTESVLCFFLLNSVHDNNYLAYVWNSFRMRHMVFSPTICTHAPCVYVHLLTYARTCFRVCASNPARVPGWCMRWLMSRWLEIHSTPFPTLWLTAMPQPLQHPQPANGVLIENYNTLYSYVSEAQQFGDCFPLSAVTGCTDAWLLTGEKHCFSTKLGSC